MSSPQPALCHILSIQCLCLNGAFDGVVLVEDIVDFGDVVVDDVVDFGNLVASDDVVAVDDVVDFGNLVAFGNAVAFGNVVAFGGVFDFDNALDNNCASIITSDVYILADGASFNFDGISLAVNDISSGTDNSSLVAIDCSTVTDVT